MTTNHTFAITCIRDRYNELHSFQNRYILLHKAIKQCIVKGELPDNWLLPSTRELAKALNLSRTTVLKSYELLSLEKLIVSTRGSGSKVCHVHGLAGKGTKAKVQALSNLKYPEISEKGKSFLQNISLINTLPDQNLAFRPGVPPIDVFPVNQWKKLLNSYWRHVKSSGLSYTAASGLLELKKSISTYLTVSRNIKTTPEQIVIVSGGLQSLFLIANTLVNEGDAVVLENPTFPNIHSVFKSTKAQLIPLSLDSEGIRIHDLKTNKKKPPKIVAVTPSNHYPLGIKMSLNRRHELLHWASKYGSLIIEDDYENEIASVQEGLPTIYSLDKEDRTVYIGTFNRLLHPSIRLGYMIVPRYLMPAVEAFQEHSHRFVSPSIQVVMNQFIEKNYLFQHLKNCIKVAEERHGIFQTAFSQKITSMYLQDKPFSSFHVVAFFKSDKSTEEEILISELLKSNDIIAFPLSKCYVKGPRQTGLIFGYSAVRPASIREKIEKLSRLI